MVDSDDSILYFLLGAITPQMLAVDGYLASSMAHRRRQTIDSGNHTLASFLDVDCNQVHGQAHRIFNPIHSLCDLIFSQNSFRNVLALDKWTQVSTNKRTSSAEPMLATSFNFLISSSPSTLPFSISSNKYLALRALLRFS